MNYEMNCEECKRVIGFTNIQQLKANKKKPRIFKCIDCSFREQTEYYKKLKGDKV